MGVNSQMKKDIKEISTIAADIGSGTCFKQFQIKCKLRGTILTFAENEATGVTKSNQ